MKWLAKNLVLIVAIAGVATATLFALWPRPIAVDLATAERGPLRVTVDEDGKTRVRERYVVSAPLAGQMTRIDLEAGDNVEAGKTLLTMIEPLDPSLLDDRTRAEAEARVRAAQAARDLASARIEEAREFHELARHEFARTSLLRRSQSAPQAEYDRAEHEQASTAQALRSAEFGLQVATFELDMAKAALLRTRPRAATETAPEGLELRAPITGRVLRVMQESARVVERGLPLLELGDPEQMEVEIDVLSSDAAAISPGAKVWLERWGAGPPLEARVRLVEPSGFTKVSALGVEEQRVNVIADFIAPFDQRSTLGDAYRVEACIVVWESADVLKILAGCLFRHQQQWAVYRVVGNVARLQVVQIGRNNGIEAEVLGGLTAGDRVIQHPSDKLSDNANVAVRADR